MASRRNRRGQVKLKIGPFTIGQNQLIIGGIAVIALIIIFALMKIFVWGPADRKAAEAAKKAEEDKYKLQALTENQLQGGMFYVKTGSKFYAVNPGSMQGDGRVAEKADPETRLFVLKDNDSLTPTMYEDSTLVYKAKDGETIPDTFTMERFKDLGWTFGMFWLKDSGNNGKLRTTVSPYTFYPGSSITGLKVEQGNDLIVDKVGGMTLTDDMVSQVGTVLNLKKGSTYQVDAYNGSQYIGMQAEADVHAFNSYEIYQVARYDMNQNSYISLKFPLQCQSGYYLINGVGMLRFVHAKSGDSISDIEYNVPYYLGTASDGSPITNPVDGFEAYNSLTDANKSYAWSYQVEVPEGQESLGIGITYTNVMDRKKTDDSDTADSADAASSDSSASSDSEEKSDDGTAASSEVYDYNSAHGSAAYTDDSTSSDEYTVDTENDETDEEMADTGSTEDNEVTADDSAASSSSSELTTYAGPASSDSTLSDSASSDDDKKDVPAAFIEDPDGHTTKFDQKTFTKSETFVNADGSYDEGILSLFVNKPKAGTWTVHMSGMSGRQYNIQTGQDQVNTSGTNEQDITIAVANDLQDGVFNFTWDNKDATAVFTLTSPTGQTYSTDKDKTMVSTQTYGALSFDVGEAPKGTWKVSITGGNLGKVYYTYEDQGTGNKDNADDASSDTSAASDSSSSASSSNSAESGSSVNPSGVTYEKAEPVDSSESYDNYDDYDESSASDAESVKKNTQSSSKTSGPSKASVQSSSKTEGSGTADSGKSADYRFIPKLDPTGITPRGGLQIDGTIIDTAPADHAINWSINK